MKAHLLKVWDSIQTSFWFIPTVMATLAIALSFGTILLDEYLGTGWSTGQHWIYNGSAEGARLLLSSVAGSMLTVAGTTFSITIAVLTLASGQFGPRLLRTFMRDRGNQVVLGTFIAGFVYCLSVLRTVRGGDESSFVPQISVTLGVGMALAGVGVLIYFIHHVAQSIQVSTVVAEVGADLDVSIDLLFPTEVGSPPPDDAEHAPTHDLPARFHEEAAEVRSRNQGYIMAIDQESLMHTAAQAGVIVQVVHRPGDWVVRGAPLGMLWPGEQFNDDIAHAINQAFVLGNHRTQGQDIRFSVHQLVEIAIRALSPGINDPFTALNCIDRLGASLCRMAEREQPSAYRYDDQGRLRVIASPETFAGMVDDAFDQIRQYGRTSVAVTLRLLETIELIATRVRSPEARVALLQQAMMIERGSHEDIPEARDRKDVQERFQAIVRRLAPSRPD